MPATRYSEDIDLVFLRNEPIGAVMEQLRTALSWFPMKPRYEVREFPKLYFRFATTSGTVRRIKVEVATREAFSAPRAIEVPYAIDSAYFSGKTSVRTYTLEELLATKLRALYQRQKGRDLYDLWYAAQQRRLDFDTLFALFLEYWRATGLPPLRRANVRANIALKKQTGVFAQVAPLLVPGNTYDAAEAEAWFDATVLPLFPI